MLRAPQAAGVGIGKRMDDVDVDKIKHAILCPDVVAIVAAHEGDIGIGREPLSGQFKNIGFVRCMPVSSESIDTYHMIVKRRECNRRKAILDAKLEAACGLQAKTPDDIRKYGWNSFPC